MSVEKAPQGTALDKEMARWQKAVAGFKPGRKGYSARMSTPAVLQAMGERSKEIELPNAYLDKIIRRHGDIPTEVLWNLPALLHDPLFAYPARQGGTNLVLEAITGKGEPIIVGVREGVVRTITPINHEANRGGWEILRERTEAALRTEPGKLPSRAYARLENNEAAWSGWSDLAASTTAENGTASLGLLFRSRSNVISNKTLVKKHGENYYQSAYHGSPYRFDRFGLEHIGSGEGAQVYGWGLYFAGNREVAEYYRRKLSFNDSEIQDLAEFFIDRADGNDRLAVEDLKLAAVCAHSKDRKKNYLDAAAWIEGGKIKSNPGQTYKVNISENDVLLDWDKPLSEQPEKVRDALMSSGLMGDGLNIGDFPQGVAGGGMYKALVREKGSPRAVSEYLNAMGIEGIRYLDSSSRGDGAGTYNYVVFDDKTINILETFYQNQALPRASFNPVTLTIALTQTADLSSYLHESGHLFLTIQTDVSTQLAAKPEATLTAGERSYLADTKALLDWFRVPSLEAWNAMSHEEKRPHHEKFARGFEQYLLEGKAPNDQLRGVFQRASDWLRQVYRNLRSLDVRLPTEVRAVFDRMLSADNRPQAPPEGAHQDLKQNIIAQLKATGQFSPEVCQVYAAIMGSYYETSAARIGVTPKAFWQQYSPRIVTEEEYNANVLHQKGMRDDYTLDSFGLPNTGRNAGLMETASSGRKSASLSRDDAEGEYGTRTVLVSENTRQLGIDRVTTIHDAAQALAYLGRGAVERFDALVTDANGKPLAIVGAFKGESNQVGVYVSTIANEAFRVNGARHIWFAHNHPSGDTKFSKSDELIHRDLTEAFRGSEIEPKGIFVIGKTEGNGRAWAYEPSNGRYEDYMRGVTSAPSSGASVPVVECEIDAERKLGPQITDFKEAKSVSRQLSGENAGILLLSKKNIPVGFVPVKPGETGELRRDGRMDALYRALSISNAGAVIIVNNESLQPREIENLAGFFNAHGARVLDVIEKTPDDTLSWTDQGKFFNAVQFYQEPRAVSDSLKPVLSSDSVHGPTNAANLIKRQEFSSVDRQAVQDMVIEAVERDPEKFLRGYVADTRSFGGRYISADLMKEQFDQYAISREGRNRYNQPVHNAAAVLAAEQFRRMMEAPPEPGRNTVMFLTGCPGAGKTTAVMEAGGLPGFCHAIYEGQLSRPETGMEKIQLALDAGHQPVIVAVHPLPEIALSNTLSRFEGYGRGSSIHAMADIQGNLPNGLVEIHRRFGNAVELHIADYRNPYNPVRYNGWEHLSVLRSEGSYDQIKQRLDAALERHRAEISVSAWRQAKGLAPVELSHRELHGQHACHMSPHGDGHGRGASGDSIPAMLSAEPRRTYHGPILTVDQSCVLQITPEGFVCHDRASLSGALAIQPGKSVSIHYPYERVGFVREAERAAIASEKTYQLPGLAR